jgi:hypothetical protein
MGSAWKRMENNSMAERREPVRMCVICRKRFPKSQLMRYVPAGQDICTVNGLDPDEAQIMPGRGWYVCDNPQCRRRFMERKFRRKLPGTDRKS